MVKEIKSIKAQGEKIRKLAIQTTYEYEELNTDSLFSNGLAAAGDGG